MKIWLFIIKLLTPSGVKIKYHSWNSHGILFTKSVKGPSAQSHGQRVPLFLFCQSLPKRSPPSCGGGEAEFLNGHGVADQIKNQLLFGFFPLSLPTLKRQEIKEAGRKAGIRKSPGVIC